MAVSTWLASSDDTSVDEHQVDMDQAGDGHLQKGVYLKWVHEIGDLRPYVLLVLRVGGATLFNRELVRTAFNPNCVDYVQDNFC